MLRQDYKGCPLCQSAEQQLIGEQDCQSHDLWHEGLPTSITWIICSSCKHLYTKSYWTEAGLEQVFKKAHDCQVATIHEKPDVKRMTWRQTLQTTIELLGGYRTLCNQKPKKTWLDAGCGDGALVMVADEFGFDAMGLDTRQSAVTAIKEQGYKAMMGNIMQVTLQTPVDVVSMMDVIEHVPYPKETLKKVHSLLKTGGVLVLSTPNTHTMSWRQMDKLGNNLYWRELEHHHSFSRQRLMELLEETGFVIERYDVNLRYKAQMEIYATRV